MKHLKCNKCEKVKPASKFHVRPSRKRGYHYACKNCHYQMNRKNLELKPIQVRRDYLNKWRGEYRKGVLQKYGDRCGVCQTVILKEKERHIDHDHVTGVIRGVLCRKCNLGLGMFNDSPELLATAISHILKHLEQIERPSKYYLNDLS